MSYLLGLACRRWLTLLAGLVLTAAACVYVSTQVQPVYRATSQVFFLLPPESPDPDKPAVNPYLNVPDGMVTTASLIAGMVSTKDVQTQLADRGLDAEYTVTAVTSEGPLLDIIVTGASAQVALATRDELMELVDEDLATLQAEADTPGNQLMTASRPVVSQEAEVIRTPVYRAVAATLGAGLLAVLLLCVLVERLARIRPGRAARKPASSAAEAVAAAKERSRQWRLARDGDAEAPGAADTDERAEEDAHEEADEEADAEAEEEAEEDAHAYADADSVSQEEPEDGESVPPRRRPAPSVARSTSRRRRERTARRHDTTALEGPHEGGPLEDAPRKLAG